MTTKPKQRKGVQMNQTILKDLEVFERIIANTNISVSYDSYSATNEDYCYIDDIEVEFNFAIMEGKFYYVFPFFIVSKVKLYFYINYVATYFICSFIRVFSHTISI